MALCGETALGVEPVDAAAHFALQRTRHRQTVALLELAATRQVGPDRAFDGCWFSCYANRTEQVFVSQSSRACGYWSHRYAF